MYTPYAIVVLCFVALGAFKATFNPLVVAYIVVTLMCVLGALRLARLGERDSLYIEMLVWILLFVPLDLRWYSIDYYPGPARFVEAQICFCRSEEFFLLTFSIFFLCFLFRILQIRLWLVGSYCHLYRSNRLGYRATIGKPRLRFFSGKLERLCDPAGCAHHNGTHRCPDWVGNTVLATVAAESGGEFDGVVLLLDWECRHRCNHWGTVRSCCFLSELILLVSHLFWFSVCLCCFVPLMALLKF